MALAGNGDGHGPGLTQAGRLLAIETGIGREVRGLHGVDAPVIADLGAGADASVDQRRSVKLIGTRCRGRITTTRSRTSGGSS